MKPLNGYVALKIEKKEKEGSILLPSSTDAVSEIGTVMAVAPDVEDVEIGDRVYYYERTRYQAEGCDMVHIDDIVAKVIK